MKHYQPKPYRVVMGVGMIHRYRKNDVYGARGIGEIVMNAKAVTVMGDAIIFMAGLGAGSLITIFILMVALISDDIRRESDK